MIAALLAWVSAFADPATELLAAREQVELAAAEVARARAEGEGRSAVAARMATYRAKAAELERRALEAGPPPEQLRRDRRDAMATLARMLAEGVLETPARAVLVAWLGDPATRASLLRSAVDSGAMMPTEIRRGVLLDVLEQTDALAVLLSFDAAAEAGKADRLELRALSLRRRGPGQMANIADEVEAVRFEEEARRAEEVGGALVALRSEVLEVRQQAVRSLTGEER